MKELGTHWRLISPHRIHAARRDHSCVIVDNSENVSPFDYAVQFDDGKILLVTEKELAPIGGGR